MTDPKEVEIQSTMIAENITGLNLYSAAEALKQFHLEKNIKAGHSVLDADKTHISNGCEIKLN